MAVDKRKKAATESLAFIAIGTAVLVLLNILGVFSFARWDVTDKQLFSLSDGSKRLVANLEDELEITAYFTADLPPPFNATARYVRDLLDEYEAASGGNVKVRFIDPSDEEAQKQARDEGVQKVGHQKLENDSVQVVEGYRGVVFKYLGERKTLPAIEDTKGLEYEITQLLKQLTGEKTRIGLVKDKDGPTLAEGLTALKGFLPTYDLVEVDTAQPIGKGMRALLVVSPSKTFTEDELRNIDAYVMNGGSLGVFGGGLKVDLEQGNLQNLSGSDVDTGLNRMLEKWGVKFAGGAIADAQCDAVLMPTPLGIPMRVPYPPMPMVSFDEEQASHPAAYNLDQLSLPFSAPLKLTKALADAKGISKKVVAQTSKNSWVLGTGEAIDLKAREPREWRADGTNMGPYPVVVAVEGKLPSAFKAEPVSGSEAAPTGPKGPDTATEKVQVLVVSTGMFLNDKLMPPPDRQGNRRIGTSVAFALNAIDWLAQEDELIAIRAKNVEDPQLEVPSDVINAEETAKAAAQEGDKTGMENALEERKEALSAWDSKKRRYVVFNVLGMPILLVLFGLVRWQVRKRQRANLKL